MNKYWWLILGLLVVVGGVMWWRRIGSEPQSLISGGGGFNFPEDVKGKENLAKLKQGCPFKDCIPSIDNPKFESAKEADLWLEDDEVVFAIDYKGKQRAYPQRILNWHEIVNDKIGGEALVITFCPLCGSAIAFDRQVEGKVLEFGVSGKLHDSDLVMYDRETESLWQQITGEAIVGEYFGKMLAVKRMDALRWSEWRDSHPGTEVLSRETGYSRDYSKYPYGSYQEDNSVYFPVEEGVDQTIHPKTVVYGVEVNGEAKAYTKEALERDTKKKGAIIDELGGEQLRLSFNNGKVRVENLKVKEEVITTRLFWFAWKAFNRDTQLYK